MKLKELFGSWYDLVFRLLPHRAQTGLIRIGNPGPEDPVLVTGNYTLTIRRLHRALSGYDAWLLAADSKGINVWCAAGGGHLTHHDVIAVVRTSGITERVAHRQLVLPQLGATGIERSKVFEATGWDARWGPAHLEDLPAYLQRKKRVKKWERSVRFPLWQRLEMALIWILPFLLLGLPVAYVLDDWPSVLALAIIVPLMVIGLFASLPWVNMRGWRRWAILASLAMLGVVLGVGGLALFSDLSNRRSLITGGMIILAVLFLTMDFEGTTPWFGSVINTFRNKAFIDLIPERCAGEADCVLVCPRDVFWMRGDLRKVGIVRQEDCIQCGACIVQCPRDALRFRYENGQYVGAETIRRTRLNLVARRTVIIEPKED